MEREIEATTSVRSPLAKAYDVFRDDPGAVFAPETANPEERRSRRFVVGLAAPVGSGTAIDHDVELHVGTVTIDDSEVRVPIDWVPTGHQRVLPEFHGVLVLRTEGRGRTGLELRGSYAVPLGPVGRFGDAVVGRRIARTSVAALLERLAQNLDHEVDRSAAVVNLGPTPYNVDLRETEPEATSNGSRPEHFIG